VGEGEEEGTDTGFYNIIGGRNTGLQNSHVGQPFPPTT